MNRLMSLFFRGAILALLAAALCAPGRAGEPKRAPVRPACVPEGAEAWLVLPAPEASMERVRKLAEAVLPGRGPLAEVTLKGQLVKHGGDAVDVAKPLVAALTLGEKPAYAVAVALKAEGDVAKALEARFGRAAKAEEGISTFLEVQEGALPDKEVYAAVKAGRLVVGDSLELVKLLAAAPVPAAGDFEKDLDAVAGLDVKAISARHKEKLEEFLKKLETNPREALGGRFGRMLAAGLQGGAKGHAAFLRVMLRECEQVGTELRLGEEELSSSWLMLPSAEGRLAALAAKLSGAKAPDAGPLSSGTLGTFAGRVPPEANQAVGELLAEILAAAAAGDEELSKETDALAAAWKELAAQSDGTTAAAISRRAGGICIARADGVKDVAAARQAALKLLRSGTSKGITALWDPAGAVKVEVAGNHRQAGGVAVDRLTVELVVPDNLEGNAAGMAEVRRQIVSALYGHPMVCETGAAAKNLFWTFGKESPKALDELLARAAEGAAADPQALAAVSAKAPKGCFALGEMSMLEYVRAMTGAFGQLGEVPKLDLGEGPGKPVTFWARSAEGRLSARFNVPVEVVKKLAAALRKARQEMIQQRQRPPEPLPGDAGVEQF